MSEAQEKIKWGDVLRLHGVSTVPGKENKGLIISKGYFLPYLDSLIQTSTIKPMVTMTRSISIDSHSSKSFLKVTLISMINYSLTKE